MLRVIHPRSVYQGWPPLMEWLHENGYDPREVISVTDNSDGTYTLTVLHLLKGRLHRQGTHVACEKEYDPNEACSVDVTITPARPAPRHPQDK